MSIQTALAFASASGSSWPKSWLHVRTPKEDLPCPCVRSTAFNRLVTLNWATDTSDPTHGLTSEMAVRSVEAKSHRLFAKCLAVIIRQGNVLNTDLSAPQNRALRYFCIPPLPCSHHGIQEVIYFPVPDVAAGSFDQFLEPPVAPP